MFQLSVVGVSLTYYAVSGHLVTLAGDVTDQFHRGLCRAFMDLTLMASWNQVHGVLRAMQIEAMHCDAIQKAEVTQTLEGARQQICLILRDDALSWQMGVARTVKGLKSLRHALNTGVCGFCVEQNSRAWNSPSASRGR